jgi:DNA-binding PadR family transcriptional regulator
MSDKSLSDEFLRLSKIEALILRMLVEQQEMFGLEMISKSAGVLKRGTIYVTLGRMQDKGLIESKQVVRPAPQIGIPRRLYSISALGNRALAAHDAARSAFDNFEIVGGL